VLIYASIAISPRQVKKGANKIYITQGPVTTLIEKIPNHINLSYCKERVVYTT